MSEQHNDVNSLHDEKINATGSKPKYPEAVNEFAEEFSDGAYGSHIHEEAEANSELKQKNKPQ